MKKPNRKLAWLGAIAAVAGAAGGGALDAVVQAVTSGHIDPASLGKTAAIGAVIGVSGYFKRAPEQVESAPAPVVEMPKRKPRRKKPAKPPEPAA